MKKLQVEVLAQGGGVVVEVSNGWINIYRPTYFGKTPIRARITDVAVIDPFGEEIEETESDSDPELAHRTRVTYLNRQFTPDSKQIHPNLLLLFGERVTLPRVRPWTWVTPQGLQLQLSYKGMGRIADGVFLLVANSAVAVRELVSAGAMKTTRPSGWLRDHRPRSAH
jgi:hypothetical protein